MSARRPSISRRLTRMNILVSGTVLVVAALVLVAYDVLTLRESMVRALSTEAQIIGANSASALVFEDPRTAESTLNALKAAPNVLYGGIYQPDGNVFAEYQRDPAVELFPLLAIAPGADEQYRFTSSELQLARRVVLDEQPTGIVFLRSDLAQMTSRLQSNLTILGVVLAASLAAAFFVSRIAQRAVAQPLIELAETARRVSHDRLHSIRAAARGDDYEVALLVEAFNDMLVQIERDDRRLKEAHDELEIRVRERTSELAAANKELEAFSYSESHDLRAPLRHVLGFTTLLRQRAEPVLDEQNRRYLTTIADAAQRMGRLIDDLLAFSRTSRTNLEKRRVSLVTLVKEAQAEALAAAGGHEIRWTIQEDLPEVCADPALIRLVLVNLLSNAIKYSGTRNLQEIAVGCRIEPREIVVFVKDNGVGFDMQYAHKLFGVFQRLHAAEDFEGTGIGLANVQRIINRHGGRVWAESALNEGATFSFSLPRESSG
jgi:signal transduction histidine kinase